MKIIIDRFEGNLAVVELPNRTTVNLPIILIPNAKVGDVISIEIDDIETNERKSRIDGLANKLFKS